LEREAARVGRSGRLRRAVAAGLPQADNLSMPEALDVNCPCCGALLKVDPETASVVWADQKKAPPQDFDDLVSRVHSQKDVLDEKFARSVQQTRHQRDILEKKFEEARRRAAADPTARPPHPFDNE
jgi:hypothetical protein